MTPTQRILSAFDEIDNKSSDEFDDCQALREWQAQKLTALTNALRLSVEAIEYYHKHESVIKEAYHSNDERQITCVHTFINHKATEALTAIATALTSGGEG